MKKAEVKFENITKKFNETTAVDNVSCKFEAGTLTTLLGPSGCGKTTSLRIIAGLERATSGKILVDDEDVTLLPATDRDVSMVFQSYALFPHMSVIENVSYGLKMVNVNKEEYIQKSLETLKLVNLEGYENRMPSELSGGQQQRVAVARAIGLEPKVLLFDEPLSNLDAALRHDTRVEIAKLHRQLGATTVYVTHDQVEAMTLADKIVVLKDGEVMQVGAPMELFNYPANKFVAGFLGSPKMNFFESKLILVNSPKTSGKVEFDGHTSNYIRLVSKEKSAGELVHLGIRPQDLKIKDNGAIVGKVTLVERLGTETVVELLSKSEVPFRFASPETLDLEMGSQVSFTYDRQKAHIF